MKISKKNFLNYLNTQYIFEKKPSIAVAVSGGPDSIALLYLLQYWIKCVNGKLVALIIDHNLRSDSFSEAQLVLKKLKKDNIRAKVLSVRKSSINKRSMKEARDNRFNKLLEYCKRNNILHLFIGHNYDDNLETYLLRKIAGSDIEGLFSIKDYVVREKIILYRPLLNVSKDEIYSFNKKNNLDFIQDPTNMNLNYSRPSVRSYLTKIKKNVLKEINYDFNVIKKNAPLFKLMKYEIFLKNLCYANKNKIKISYTSFKKIDKIIIESIIRDVYSYFYTKAYVVRSNKIQIMINNLLFGKHLLFNLRGMLIRKTEDCLIFTKISS